MPQKHTHEDSHVARFVRQRVLELRPKKSQGEIAAEVGFPNPNMITLIKTGASKLPALLQNSGRGGFTPEVGAVRPGG